MQTFAILVNLCSHSGKSLATNSVKSARLRREAAQETCVVVALWASAGIPAVVPSRPPSSPEALIVGQSGTIHTDTLTQYDPVAGFRLRDRLIATQPREPHKLRTDSPGKQLRLVPQSVPAMS